MHEDARSMVGDGIGYLVGGEYGREGEIPSGERFADAHDVRFHTGMFPGKELAGTSEAGSYLIEDEQDLMFPAETGGFTQVLRMVEPHASGSLYDGLQNQGGQGISMGFEGLFQRQDVVWIPFAVETGTGLGDKMTDRKRRTEEGVHAGDGVAYGHGIPSIAVVATTDGDEIVFPGQVRFRGFGQALGVPVLDGHLQGDFDGYRAGIGVEYLL